ncbi:hypothetical protein [Alicyclobacillus herbarius]|uniref:hypothetical protein n=1 Tax=Alicyclobacillus herbarius TaxID=122960 RepID=UPI000423CED5|nr:hypothetical protein [Alicyclobacillus herbarius]
MPSPIVTPELTKGRGINTLRLLVIYLDARASNDVQLLHQLPQSQGDIHEAWWPFFFFPFFALLWLWPWAWWL